MAKSRNGRLELPDCGRSVVAVGHGLADRAIDEKQGGWLVGAVDEAAGGREGEGVGADSVAQVLGEAGEAGGEGFGGE